MKLTDKLEKLLTKRAAMTQQRDEHKQLATRLEGEEKKMLEGADLSDAGQFKKISDLRLRREIVPRKIEQFGEGLAELDLELRDACAELNGELFQVIQQRKQEAHRELCAALGLFLTGRGREIGAVASKIFYETNLGLTVEEPEVRLGINVIMNRPLLLAASELLALAPQIEGLKVYCDPPGERFHIRTIEELEKKELAELLKDPEPFILAKMEYGCGREQAEKSVTGRKILLQQKLQPQKPAARRVPSSEETEQQS